MIKKAPRGFGFLVPGNNLCALLTSTLGPGSFAFMKKRLRKFTFCQLHNQRIPEQAAVLVRMVVVDMVGEGWGHVVVVV